MKTEEEVQRAHDLVTGILIEKELREQLPLDVRESMTATADVLCWVLQHEHNQTFLGNMRKFEDWALKHGFSFSKVN